MIISKVHFIIIFYYSSAQVKSLPGLKDIDNANKVDVEEILKELSAERAKNRDLNQTISDILDKISNLEDAIETNSLRITENRSFMMVVSDDLTDKLAVLADDVATVAEETIRNEEKITENQSSLILLALGVAEIQDDLVNVFSNLSFLNQSISDVNSISKRNTESIAEVNSTVVRNSVMITNLTEDIISLNTSDLQQETRIEQNIKRLEAISTRGRSIFKIESQS